MPLGSTAQDDLLKLVFNATPIAGIASNAASSPLTSLYLALHTADPGESGSQTTSETNYTGYARTPVARTSSGWTVSGGTVSNTAAVQGAGCTSGSATITHVTVGTAASGAGSVLFRAELASSIAVVSGRAPRFPAGSISASFQPPSHPLLIQLSGTNRYPVDGDGNPWFLHGDTAWSAIVQLNQSEAQQYLDDRESRGFNCIVVELIETFFSDNPPENAFGDEPFTTPGELDTQNEVYWQHVDWFIDECAERGIVVMANPLYFGFNGGSEGWWSVASAEGSTKVQNYGAWIGNRYKNKDNIIWSLAGDYTPASATLVNALHTGIASADTRHLFTIHWAPETISTGQLSGSINWVDLNSVYTYDPSHVLERTAQGVSGPVPHFLFESDYENDINAASNQEIRAAHYWALLEGAFGHMFGNNPIWKFASGWQAALDDRGSLDQGHILTLFSGINWTALTPDTGTSFVTSGRGTFGSSNYVGVSRNSTLAVLYMPTSGSRTVNLSLMTTPVTARWFDPTNGSFSTISTSLSGSQSFSPTSNSVGDADKILVLTTT